jgi:tRNA (guanine37-N1)-methyltransferase
VEWIRAGRGTPDAVVLPSPQGTPFTHAVAGRLSRAAHIVVLCGRYEGVDERVRDALATEEVSIGDYVLSGGELPALVILDAVTRLLPGAVGDPESVEADSFVRGLLDHPHYTRPADFRGMRVPDVLLSGHHEQVRRWRLRESLRRTRQRRPDLLNTAPLSAEERALLADIERESNEEPRS